MSLLQLTIPAQDGDRTSIRIRPREVKDWLENLPFLDLQRTARLVREQLRLMNRQPMPASQRLGILGEFLAAYQRLEEALTNDQPLASQLRHLCQDIAFGYKIVIHDLVNRPSGFMEGRNLPMALLGAVHVLGLQLLDCYTAYRRAPRALWSECLELYRYAWQQGRETFRGELPGYGEQQIDASFRLIALLHLADPYHLPGGMAEAMSGYFRERVDLCAVHSEPPENKNCFALRERFQESDDNRPLKLYLEIDALLERMQTDTLKLQQAQQAPAIGLRREIPAAALLCSLGQIVEQWRHHPTRHTDREQTHARIELVCGLDAVYCMVNQGRCFDPAKYLAAGHEQHIDLGVHPADDGSVQKAPEPFICTSINRSNGGLALRYCGVQMPHPRVGQLMALRRPGPQAHAGWVVAVCRWLIEAESDKGFELGLQYLTREPHAVVIRTQDSSGVSGPFQPAIAAVQKRGEQRVHTLITRSGENLRAGVRINVYEQGRQQQAVCGEKLESGPGFERLLYQAD